MSYSIYYPNSCETAVPDHVCDGCIGNDVEHGRVRSIALIAKSYYATLIADPDDPTLWTAGVADKKIIIIPETSGAYDGGSPIYGPGYGDITDRLIGYAHTLTYKDPNYKLNAAFYNALKLSGGFHIAYRTETQNHISGKPVRCTPKAPITDDIASEVVWDVEVKWNEINIPAPVAIPAGIFDNCFQYV